MHGQFVWPALSWYGKHRTVMLYCLEPWNHIALSHVHIQHPQCSAQACLEGAHMHHMHMMTAAEASAVINMVLECIADLPILANA